MNSQIELDDIVNVLAKAKKVGIFTHVSPDGDAIGSCLSAYLGLLQLKKEVVVVMDEVSSCFRFLPHFEDIRSEVDCDFDVTIALDCATRARLYDPNQSFDMGEHSIAIDHHISNTYFADFNYVEESSPATCKTLIKIFKRLGITLTKEIGECLMAGIITDTGGFRYDTVDSETFEFASMMLGLGVNISDIYYRTFDLKSKSQFELATLATSRIKFYFQDRVALTYITQADFKKVNARVGDHEGIVNVGRNVNGVEVSVFLREISLNCYRVSLRSNHYVNVSEVASRFDGGGHFRAAGCDIHDSLDVVIKKLLEEIKKCL